MRIGVVLAGGAPSQSSTHTQVVPRHLRRWLASDDTVVVAADSGLDLARRLGIVPTLVVGDLDSVTSESLAWAVGLGVEVRTSPADKDETDLDLALDAALVAGVERLVVVGGHGGRLDHLLGNLGALARVGASVPTEGWLGAEHVAVLSAVAPTWTAELPAGATVSVLPQGGPAVVSERGVRWPLDRHHLPLGSTQGISNEAAGPGEPLQITAHDGIVLVVVPDAKDIG